MPKITYSFNANISKGPSISVTADLEIEAYDKIEVAVPAGGSLTVNVQPGTGGQLLVITASSYEGLTYEVDGSGTDQTLDGPHILIGSGAVSLLGATQNDIEFNNGGGSDVIVTVLVGRDATP